MWFTWFFRIWFHPWCQYTYLHILPWNEPLEQKFTVTFSQNDFLYNKQEKLMKKYDHEMKWQNNLAQLILITFLFSLCKWWEIIPILVDIFWIIKQMHFVYISKKLIFQKKNDLVSGLTSSYFWWYFANEPLNGFLFSQRIQRQRWMFT